MVIRCGFDGDLAVSGFWHRVSLDRWSHERRRLNTRGFVGFGLNVAVFAFFSAVSGFGHGVSLDRWQDERRRLNTRGFVGCGLNVAVFAFVAFVD